MIHYPRIYRTWNMGKCILQGNNAFCHLSFVKCTVYRCITGCNKRVWPCNAKIFVFLGYISDSHVSLFDSTPVLDFTLLCTYYLVLIGLMVCHLLLGVLLITHLHKYAHTLNFGSATLTYLKFPTRPYIAFQVRAILSQLFLNFFPRGENSFSRANLALFSRKLIRIWNCIKILTALVKIHFVLHMNFTP